MIYFDNAATTPLLPSTQEVAFGNPSSPHSVGIRAERELTAARRVMASLLNCADGELTFTSGGTESNNLAIIGAAMEHKKKGCHIITSQVEHPSVENALKVLENAGFEVTRLPISQTGEISASAVVDALRNDTIMVSLMHINNETGTVFDISNISQLVKEKNDRVLFHTDAVQSFCKEQLNMKHIDLYSLSAHKIHGAKGVGALFIRKGTRIKPLLYGGGQQGNIRPGTENTSGIASFGTAAECQMKSHKHIKENISAIRNELADIVNTIENVYINGSGSPFILNMSFLGIKGETLVHALESEGIYISSGAACNTKHPGQSSLYALKLGSDRVDSAVRFSFSCFNTLDEAAICKKTVIKTVKTLRGNLTKSVSGKRRT